MLTTSLYAALLAFVYIALSVNIIRKRWIFKVGIGDGGNHELIKAIRCHGNFAEYVPFALILIALCDYAAYPTALIHLLGLTLLIARILHAYGLQQTSRTSYGRTIGMLATFLVMIVAALALIWAVLQAYI